MTDLSYDAVIVGAGPAGLSAAQILGRCRRRVVVFDIGAPRIVARCELTIVAPAINTALLKVDLAALDERSSYQPAIQLRKDTNS